MEQHRPASFGDQVRIAHTPLTVATAFADRIGTCHGWTTPSASGIRAIGLIGDVALNVGFDGGQSAWFDASLVIFIEIAAIGTTITVGDRTFVRDANGQWVPPDGA